VNDKKEYYKNVMTRGKDVDLLVKKIPFRVGEGKAEVEEVVRACNFWPIRQFIIQECTWRRFFDRYIREVYYEAVTRKCSVRFHKRGSSSMLLGMRTKVTKFGRSSTLIDDEPTLTPGEVSLSGKEGMSEKEFNRLAIAEGMNSIFPFKKNSAGESKQNVYFDDVLRSISDSDACYYDSVRSRLHQIVGLTNDQACQMMISHYALYCAGHMYDILHYVTYLLCKEHCKALSDLTKVMGVANAPYLTYFTEADSLLGRGSVLADGDKELRELSSGSPPDGHDIRFQRGVVYKETVQVLREALPDVVRTPRHARWHVFAGSEDEYWRRRHVNCVNGSHHLPRGADDYEYIGTKTRMQYLERQAVSPLFKTKPVIEAVLSWKFENPKVRAIKSGDTYSYLNEDYLMKAVEKVWKHNEVLLEPSLGSKFREGERLDKMLGEVYSMLDYSAMDKQHSLQSQLEVTLALVHFMGAPPYIVKWFEKATLNQFLREGDNMVKLTYSLLTGRRMTTFLNTILNAVYFRIAMSGHTPLSAYFAGDDIVTRWPTDADAYKCLKLAMQSKSIFNPRKQSWGESAEFLRVANKGRLTMCYANRILASLVCGNWVNKMRLAETHLPAIFSRMSWMLDNRFMLRGLARAVLVRSLFERTKLPIGICKGICMHTVSVDDGPVASGAMSVTVIHPRTMNDEMETSGKLPSLASRDFIGTFIESHVQKCLSDDDVSALVSVFSRASHMKGLTRGYKIVGTQVTARNILTAEIMCNERHLTSVRTGALSKHPTLPALRGRLPTGTLDQLVRLVTGKERHGARTRDEWLYGDRSRCVSMPLGNDFDDAATLCKAVIFQHGTVTPTVNLGRICFT
jgi:hypothetical protein